MILALLAACALLGAPLRDAPRPTPRPMVALRPGDPLPGLADDARVDLGLRAAAEELAAGASTPDARLTPSAIRIALGRAGYPGDARFLHARGGTEPPAALIAAIPRGAPVDVGWAWRDVGGERWWVLGWAPRKVSVDPVPRDLTLDQGFPLRVDGAKAPRLFVGAPDGSVSDRPLTPSVARWVSGFHEPGEYRIEVADGDAVILLFSVFVDATVPAAGVLPGPAAVPDPRAAEVWLGEQLAVLRRHVGLRPLAPFAPFAPLARIHASCLGQIGQAIHHNAQCPGVPDLAARTYTPRARHREDVAAADTASEAWERLLDSPAHRLNLLCPTCTHIAIGADLEPTAQPRLFVVWELLEFPEGVPTAISWAR